MNDSSPTDLEVGPAMLRETVEWLANTNMHASMMEWDLHSNRILAAANELERLRKLEDIILENRNGAYNHTHALSQVRLYPRGK